MAIKVKVFAWNGLIQDVLTDSDEKVEVEIVDAYTQKYGDVGSDEKAAENYKEHCVQNGFKNADVFEFGVYKNPHEPGEDEKDEENA